MNCPSCGSELPTNAGFCGSCGYQITQAAAAPQPTAFGGSGYPSSGHPSLGYASTQGYGQPQAFVPVPSYDEVVAKGVELPIGELFGEAWEHTKTNALTMFLGFFLWALVAVVALGLFSIIPLVGPITQLLLTGPLMAGPVIVMLRIVGGRQPTIGAYFEGFKLFVPLLLLYVVSGIVAALPLIVLGIPAAVAAAVTDRPELMALLAVALLPWAYLSIAFMWAQMLVIDRGEGFWQAMMGSMKVVNRSFGRTFLLLLVTALLGTAGLVFIGVGWILVVPFSYLVLAAGFRRNFGLAGGADRI